MTIEQKITWLEEEITYRQKQIAVDELKQSMARSELDRLSNIKNNARTTGTTD